MFQRGDRDSGETLRERPDVIAEIMLRVRTDDVSGMMLADVDGRTHRLDRVRLGTDDITLWTTLNGVERRDRWKIEKLERYMEGGFVGIWGGELHNKWIADATPSPLDEATATFLRDNMPRWVADRLVGFPDPDTEIANAAPPGKTRTPF
jgi:hypothetical protein